MSFAVNYAIVSFHSGIDRITKIEVLSCRNEMVHSILFILIRKGNWFVICFKVLLTGYRIGY